MVGGEVKERVVGVCLGGSLTNIGHNVCCPEFAANSAKYQIIAGMSLALEPCWRILLWNGSMGGFCVLSKRYSIVMLQSVRFEHDTKG